MPESDPLPEVMRQLSLLEPAGENAAADHEQALHRLKQQIRPAPQSRWRFNLMANRRFALTSVLLVLFVALALSLPAVRAAASEFLGLFRVQKFAAVSVSPEQIALLERIAEDGLNPGEIQFAQEPGPPQSAASLDEAAAIVGHRLRQPEAQGEPVEIIIDPGGSGRLVINLANARTILEAAGADPSLLPDSLDGAEVLATTYPSVSQRWNDGTVLVQTAGPEIDYPDDVEPARIGEALLQALGMDRDQAQRLAASIDWTSTLVLPIPQEAATFEEVQVDGVTGLAVNSLAGHGSSLIWQKDGAIYFLAGQGTTADLLAIAASLR